MAGPSLCLLDCGIDLHRFVAGRPGGSARPGEFSGTYAWAFAARHAGTAADCVFCSNGASASVNPGDVRQKDKPIA